MGVEAIIDGYQSLFMQVGETVGGCEAEVVGDAPPEEGLSNSGVEVLANPSQESVGIVLLANITVPLL